MALSPLVSVRVACNSHPPLAALPHVVSIISTFLDPAPYWSVEQAIKSELWTLARRVIKLLESNLMMIDLNKKAIARKALAESVAKGRLDLMEQLVATFGCQIDEVVLVRGAWSEKRMWSSGFLLSFNITRQR